MIKKLILFIVLISLLFTSYSNANNYFSDVGEAHWASSVISDMTEKGIISGYPDGTFFPNKSITKAEFAKLVVYSLDLFDNQKEINFDDVNESHWAYKYIKALSDYFIVNENEFNPNEAMTREQVAYTIVKALNLEKSKYDKNIFRQFKDKDSISDGFENYISIVADNKIMIGNDDGTFNPQGLLTRAQVSQLLHNIMTDKKFSKGIKGYVKVPSYKDKIYDGKRQSLETDNRYSMSGTYYARDVGTYEVKLRLKNGYKWDDGTDESKIVAWNIVEDTQKQFQSGEATTTIKDETTKTTKEEKTSGGSGGGGRRRWRRPEAKLPQN